MALENPHRPFVPLQRFLPAGGTDGFPSENVYFRRRYPRPTPDSTRSRVRQGRTRLRVANR